MRRHRCSSCSRAGAGRSWCAGLTDGRDVTALVLPRLRVPTLILHGDDDRSVPYAAGRYLAEHIPGAQRYTFKGRGHAVYATATIEFAQAVRSFIRTGRA